MYFLRLETDDDLIVIKKKLIFKVKFFFPIIFKIGFTGTSLTSILILN